VRATANPPLPRVAPEAGGAVEVDIFGRWVNGEIAKEPLFDPTGGRIRA
jgi:hypothetical protein